MACKEGSSRKEHLRSLGKHRFGFAPCPPFEGYRESPNSVCLTLLLAARPR